MVVILKPSVCMHRGDCEPPVPGNVGKYMRVKAVATLRGVHEEESKRIDTDTEDDDPDAAGDDLNICCHGRSAAEEVLCCNTALDRLYCHAMTGHSQHASSLMHCSGAMCTAVHEFSYWEGRVPETFRGSS